MGMRTNSWGGARYAPYAFTEQGIYMLMTVLKGDLAVQQSMALIRLFKQMKDYIAAENVPNVSAGMVALATQRCRQQDHDHHAVGRYRGVSCTVRKVVARGGMITAFTFFPSKPTCGHSRSVPYGKCGSLRVHRTKRYVGLRHR